ncbi:SWIM zinc finger domain-containing protein [Caballeronia sp. S22]|uniref:SWIM zinc finger family protein n=1 Tax=Caballeronia sp. S22 TaxID=3137182 RepID=UPI0035306585
MASKTQLNDVLTLDDVQSLADLKTFARGRAYLHDGAVSRLDERDAVLRATVNGSNRYSVELKVGPDEELAYECNCPVGQSGAFCKHLVAVALSWLENSGAQVFHADEREPTKTRKRRKTTEELIAEYVATLDDDAMRELLLDAVGRDMALRDKLLFAARAASANDLPSMKAAVREATRIGRPLDWREAGGYGDGLMSLADALRQRLSGPTASHVVELSELAIAGAEKSLEQIDDSNGDVMPGILELASVHLEGCRQTSPDPIKLAERLFRFQVEGTWDTFYDVIPAYVEALGDAGLQRYRQLVENQWRQLPSLSPSDGLRRTFEGNRTRLEHAMLALAEVDGDVDELIAIRQKDLSAPYRFLLIAETCAQNGQYDDALHWARQGLSAFKEPDRRLLDFCVQEYLRRNDFVEANMYAWVGFEQRADAGAFGALMEVAQTTDSVNQARERAFALLWALVKKEEAAAAVNMSTWYHPKSRSTIVEILLASKEYEKAWAAFAGGPVATNLWATMASIRAKTHPHDAIALYHRLLPIAADQGTRKARYEEAFGIVRKIRSLRTELGEPIEFAKELEVIRDVYGAKRNFMKLLASLT